MDELEDRFGGRTIEKKLYTAYNKTPLNSVFAMLFFNIWLANTDLTGYQHNKNSYS